MVPAANRAAAASCVAGLPGPAARLTAGTSLHPAARAAMAWPGPVSTRRSAVLAASARASGKRTGETS